jgi:hypothetical protein
MLGSFAYLPDEDEGFEDILLLKHQRSTLPARMSKRMWMIFFLFRRSKVSLWVM